MSREIRNFAEGNLRWVDASGTGGWVTAAGAATALVGFVQAGMNFSTAQEVQTILERGSADHHKIASLGPGVDITFTYLQGVTGNSPNPGTAAGASVPAVHFEIRHDRSERVPLTNNPRGYFWQFIHCTLLSKGWTEQAEGNQYQETWRALAIDGPSASGYLSFAT